MDVANHTLEYSAVLLLDAFKFFFFPLMSVLCFALIIMEAPGAEADSDLYFLELPRINFIQWRAESGLPRRLHCDS